MYFFFFFTDALGGLILLILIEVVFSFWFRCESTDWLVNLVCAKIKLLL